MHYIKYGNREGRKTSGVKEIANPVTVKNGVDYSKVYNYKDYLKNREPIQSIFPIQNIHRSVYNHHD